MIHRFGAFELDTDRVELRGPHGALPVEPQVFDVLAYLVEHRDRVVPKEELLDQIWGDRFVSESALTSRLKSARRAVGDDGRRQEVIRTVHGRGYRFIAAVDDPGRVVEAVDPAGVASGRAAAPLEVSGDAAGHDVPSHAVVDVGWPLLGRQRELQRLAELFHGSGVGGVLLTGPAGMGKTRLAREGVALAAAAGWPVARAHGHPEASDVPLACLAHLLPSGIADASATAIDQDLVRGALFQRAHQALEARAGGQRLLLMVDDVDQVDPLSRALLTSLVTAGTAFAVLTQRSAGGPVAGIDRLAKDGHVERIEVGPLPDDVLDVLLYRVLAGPMDRACLGQLLAAAGGSPGLLRQLLESSIERGALVRRDNVWTLTGRLGTSVDISTLVGHRLADLDDEHRRAAELLALAGSLDLDLAEDIMGEDALDGLDLHGLLALDDGEDGPTVALASALLGEVLLAEMRPLRARRHRAELADAIESRSVRRPGDELRLVRWRLESGGAVDPDLLASTARLALLEGDESTAATLIERLRVDDPSARTTQLEAELQVRRGQMARADDFLASIDLDELDEVAATQVLRRRVTNLFYGHWRFDEALDLLAAHFDRFGTEARRSLQAQWVMLAANQGRVVDALALGEQLLPDAEGLVRLELLRA